MSGIFDQIINYSPPLIVSGTVNYKGTWDASTNNPTLNSSPAASTKGDYYVVSTAGTQFGITFAIGDWIISNGTAWEKVDLTDAVSSVFGRTGAVVGVSTDYSAVGLTNTAIGVANPSTGAFTTVTASSTIAATGAVTGSNLSGTNTGDQTTITGNAGSATVLQTARAIYGNNFDGSAALTQVIASTYGGTGNGFAKFSGPASSEKTFTLPNASSTLLYDGGALGTPASGTVTNLTGTASININGTVGATTANTGAFTSITGTTTLKIGTSSSFGGTVAQINGANVVQANGGGMVSIASTDAVAADKGGSLALGAKATGGAETNPYAMAVISGRAVNATDLSGYFAVALSNGSGTIAEKLRLTSTGLGIGVTPSAWGADRKVIQLGSGGNINGSASLAPFVEIGANFYLDTADKYLTTGVATKYRQVNGSHVFQTAVSGTAGDAITFTDRATISSTGLNSTAIGATTPSTGAFTTLSATGGASITGAVSSANAFVSTGPVTANGANRSTFDFADGANARIIGWGPTVGAAGAVNIVVASSNASILTTVARATSTGLDVTGALSSTTGANFATSSGNVGIGTSSPGSKLTVSGTDSLKVTITGGTNQNAIQLNAGGTSGAHAFYMGAGSDLIVGGDKGFAILDATSSYAGRFFIDAATGLTTIYAGLNVTALGTGLVYSNGGLLTSTNPSDARLKTDITDLSYGLSSILALRPVSYKWLLDTVNQGTQYGFIAQEVQAVMPELVKEFETTENGETVTRLGLEKEGIYAALVKSVQELNANLVAQVEILSQRLAVLETK